MSTHQNVEDFLGFIAVFFPDDHRKEEKHHREELSPARSLKKKSNPENKTGEFLSRLEIMWKQFSQNNVFGKSDSFLWLEDFFLFIL